MKIDIETMFFIRLLKLKEAKIKKYSSVESKYNVVYLFDNEEDYKYYFIDNGFDDVSKTILNAAIMKTTKKGTIIALKGLCDYAITRHREINSKLNNCEIKLNNGEEVVNKFVKEYDDIIQKKKTL